MFLKKILLIFPTSFEVNVVPPLGISIIAACLRQRGWDVELADLTVERGRHFDWEQYSMVGMTLLCVNFRQGMDLAREIRNGNKNVFIAAGGPFADTCTKEVLEGRLFDAVIHGEGETVFPSLVCAIENGSDLSIVKGLSFYQNGNIVRTQNPLFIEDLDALPFPAYDLYQMNLYGEYSVMASRGCPFYCVFCTRGPAETKHVRHLSPGRVIDWIVYLISNYGSREVRFIDSTFTLDQRWAEEICDRIISRRLRFHWTCQTRADCLSGVLLEKMKKAGCTMVTLGAESGNDQILNSLEKGFTRADLRNAARLFKDFRAPQLNLNFIIGHPWDTRETILETVALAKELRRTCSARYKLFLLVPFPGTELWNNADKYGLRISKDWEKYCKYSFMGNSHLVEATYGTREFSREELTRLYHELDNRWFSLVVRIVKKTQQFIRERNNLIKTKN
ncbi:MAG: B12-binding domain-containing radical SAM protein [Candidatus Omnitrophica bacterium]|nr:B12-binding domain-containing radical SAM protein [Candidatus Omnitrophota bacterium]